ncbi:MAG: hypothetical protein WEC81_01170 [Patescibacteria group bacterium]
MKKQLLIIGNSPLSFFVAKQLDERIGDLAHIEIVWVTTSEKIHPAIQEAFKPKQYIGSVNRLITAVKSINLNDRRVVTGKKTLDYDLLFIDQTATFTTGERDKILDQFETLIATVRAKENRGMSGKVKLAVTGASAESYQLALDLATRVARDSSSGVSSIRVEVESYPQSKLKNFFVDNHIYARKSQYPGMSIKEPMVIFSSKKIRGLRVDLAGRAILLATGEPAQHQNAIMIDADDRLFQNIGRSDWNLAKQITDNLVAKLDGTLEKPLDSSGKKLILQGSNSSYIEIGRVSSNRNRANAVRALERRFWRRLLAR